MMKKILNSILAVLGLGALVKGVLDLRSEVPKPTEDEQITRVDYLSGKYEEALNERNQEIEKSRRQAKWLVTAGMALLTGGLFVVAEGLSTGSDDDYHTAKLNGNSDSPDPKFSSEPAEETSPAK
ncbi:MAG: hypothetical protein ABEJ65_08755 [bacterium]